MSAPRFLLYARQSLTPGAPEESLSLVAQERALRELIARDGGVVLEPAIIDADEKGNDPNRPGIRTLLDRAAKEKPDGIAVYAVSRFARDNWLAEGIWRALLRTNPDMRFRSYTEPNAQDDLVRGILGVISEAERKRMGNFLKLAWSQRARQGKPHGPAPYGYIKDDDGRLVVDEDARPWIEAIYRHAENGWSLRRIALWLREEAPPLRKWEPNTVKNLLTAPAMAGGVQTSETLVWETHEPIIARDRWDAVQRLLSGRRYIRTKSVESWLEGVLFCACGARMSLTLSRTPRRGYPDGLAQFRCLNAPTNGYFRGSHPPPRCDTFPRHIVQRKAERLAVAALTADLARVHTWDETMHRLDASYRAGQKDALKDRTRLERQRATIADRQARTLTLYQLNKLDATRWEIEDQRLGGEIAAIDAALAALPAPPDARSVRVLVDALTGIRETLPELMALNPVGARRFLEAIGACFVLTPGGLVIDWPAQYAELFE